MRLRPPDHPDESLGRPRRRRSRAQVLVIFALSIFVFTGMCAVVVDIAWYWAINLRMQRAADAAALAGVVHLPGDVPTAVSVARAEATKNGYQHGVGGVNVAAFQDPGNARRLRVSLTAPVNTFFARVFGITTFNARRESRAEYVLPVPMGSPENYYGVFGLLRTPGGGTTITTPDSTSWLSPAATKTSSNWSNPDRAFTSNDASATSSTNGARVSWGNFNVSLPSGATITGIEVGIEASRTAASGNQSGCRLQVDLSWNNGSSHSTGSGDQQTPTLTTSDPAIPYYTLGGANDLWNRSTWNANELTNTSFRVRVENLRPSGTCSATAQVDYVRARIHYSTSTFVPDANIAGPYGNALTPRGFWGTMLNQGAEDINGDAYLPQYETRTGTANPEYQPGAYYDYAIEIPSGASGGEVWIYDPVFCATSGNGQYGTGDRYFGGTAATSAFYDLYDTVNQPYNLAAHVHVVGSGTLFRRVQASDQSLGGPSGISSCEQGDVTNPSDGRYWHNRWWQLASGLAPGTYRLRTATTDPNSASDQSGANGHNSFAIWTNATGGSPRVYGIGAMEAFTPLDGGQAAEFYLAQIESVHAGKTVAIKLWDPGDTGALSANLQILIPGTTGYAPANVTWSSARGTSNGGASSCNGRTGAGTSITTNTGGSSQFNGCWVTIEIAIPSGYSAPTPPGESEPGWWKIRYNMGSGSSSAFDLTTWQVEIRGNPVHLVLP